MKKISLLLISFIMLFSFSINVKAADVDSSTFPGNTGESCKRGYCWSPLLNGDNAKGMRVTLMDADGNKIAGTSTFNVMYDVAHINWLKDNYNYRYWSGNCNKAQYLKGKCNLSQQTKGNTGSLPYTINSTSTVSGKFGTFNVDFKGNLSDWTLSNIWTELETQSVKFDESRMITLMKSLFGISDEKIAEISADPEQLDRVWIVFEPLTIIRYNNHYYLGTFHELSSLGYANIVNETINSVLGRRMPCSTFVTGTIAKKYPKAPGISGSTYFGVIKSIDVTSAAAFNGSNSFTKVCTAEGGSKYNILSNDYVTSYGTGIGLVKYSDLVKKKTSCSEVEAGVDGGLKAFQSNLENYYKSGGKSNILNNYQNGIKYTDSDGNINYANTEWYINECTCYGVYQEYKDKQNVDITTLEEAAIKNIFNDKKAIFTTFVENTKKKAEEVQNAGTQSVGSVTEWTYSKYERLDCEDATFSCKDIDFNDIVVYTSTSKCRTACNNGQDNWGGNLTTSQCRSKCSDIVDNATNCNRVLEQLKNGSISVTSSSTRRRITACLEIYSIEYDTPTQWNYNTYTNAGCGFTGSTTIEKKYNCTPYYEVGTCDDGDSIYYSDASSELTDEEYWKHCVFSDKDTRYDIDVHKYSDSSKENTYYDDVISSDYCEVYCTETLTANFDNRVGKVKAGSFFTWDNHEVSGSRTCKTKSIEYDKFLEDLAEANQAVADAYADWQLEIKLSKVTWTKSTSEDCDYECDEYEQISNVCDEGVTECGTSDGKCIKGHYTDYNYKPSSTSESVSITGSYTASDSQTLSTTCGSKGYTADTDSKKQAYEDAVDEVNSIITAMKQCYNGDGSTFKKGTWYENIYEFDPSATISYSDGNYSYTGDLYVDVDYDSPESTDYSECESTTVSALKSNSDCTGTTCSVKTVNMRKCTEYAMSKSATAEFELYDGIFQYIDKSNNLSFNADSIEGVAMYQGNSNLSMSTIRSKYTNGISFNYSDIGYSVFPVAYSTPDGDYDDLSIEYKDLGHKSGTGATAVDTILNSVSSDYGDWNCGFSVESELIPEDPNNPRNPGDIIVIYRPIDLVDPFPDITATGRETGSNWCYGGKDRTDCAGNNKVVTDYITKNRNVTTTEVYKQKPMYSFILTPSAINAIRKYNDKNSYTSYTGSLNGKTYDFRCNESTDTACISDYFTELLNKYSVGLPGACKDAKYRSYNDVNSFEQCRYIGTVSDGTGKTSSNVPPSDPIYGSGVGGTVENTTVKNNFTNITYDGSNEAIIGSDYEVTLKPASGYKLPSSITVYMNGEKLTAGEDYKYDKNTGKVTVYNVTGEVEIKASGVDDTACLIKGTKIKLANGTEKNIEDIDYNDLLLVWDYEHGEYTYQYPVHIEKEGTTNSYQRATFSDGSVLETHSFHGVFSLDDMEIIRVDDPAAFHVGTRIAKVIYEDGEYKFKEITVEKIETIYEKTNYYNVLTSLYYNVVSNDILTTLGDSVVGNMYGFNDDLTWKTVRQEIIKDSNNMFEYELVKDVIPYYMYKGLRVAEYKYISNLGYFDANDLQKYVNYLGNINSNLLLKPETNESGNRVWMITTSDDELNPINKDNYLYEEGSYYTFKEPKNKDNFIGWYDTTDSKYYQPGDVIKVLNATHFIAKYK